MLKSYEYLIQSRKEHIDFINKIIEAYEGIGVVRTVNAQEGIINIITTLDFKDEVKKIILDLKERYDICIEIIEEGEWKGSLYINEK